MVHVKSNDDVRAVFAGHARSHRPRRETRGANRANAGYFFRFLARAVPDAECLGRIPFCRALTGEFGRKLERTCRARWPVPAGRPAIAWFAYGESTRATFGRDLSRVRPC